MRPVILIGAVPSAISLDSETLSVLATPFFSTLNMRWHESGWMRGSRYWTAMGGGALCTQTESGMDKELTTVGKSFGEKSR